MTAKSYPSDSLFLEDAAVQNRRTSAMLIEGKLPSQAKSFSPGRTAIVVALAVTILLVLTSVTFGPGSLLSTYTVEEASLIRP